MGSMYDRVVAHSGMKAFTSLTPQRAQTVMKPTRRPMLRLENLEDRLAPALNILQSGSFLSITGTLNPGTMLLELATTTTPGQLEITGGGPTVTYSNVSSVSVNLGASATGNAIQVNLEDGPLTGNLTINAGPSANNSVFVLDNLQAPGTDILGNLSISRANTVLLSALTVLGSATISNPNYASSVFSSYTVGGSAITGTLSITGTSGFDLATISSTTVGGNLSVNLGGNASLAAQSATIDTGTLVQGSLSILGGAGGTSANLDATVNGNVTINFGGGATLGNALTFTASALVGGAMSVTMGTSAGTGNLIDTFAGTINGNLTISLAKSSENLINYAAVVNGRLATITYQMSTLNTFNLLPGASMPNPLGRMSLYMAKGGTNIFNQSTPIDWPMTVNI